MFTPRITTQQAACDIGIQSEIIVGLARVWWSEFGDASSTYWDIS